MDQTNETSRFLSFSDAAAKVLEQTRTPLHYRKIIKQAIAQSLIKTGGETPESTLNAVFSVDREKGNASRFVRIQPGIYGLRKWGLEVSPVVASEMSTEEDRRVRIPHFPSYSELRRVLPVWDKRSRTQITGLKAAISKIRGTPQEPSNWTNPNEWIAQRLEGSDRELAEAIWQQTAGKVNPRHVYGHWLLACTYQLLAAENSSGQMVLTPRGQSFIDEPLGEAVALVDEQEGILKILMIAAEKGTGHRADFLEDWAEYLARHSRYGTDSTIKDTLSRRLQSILKRGLLTKTGTTYSITDEGLAYLRRTDGFESNDTAGELQEILQLAKRQKVSIRASMQELLATMEPIAFEHLVKQLLEAMNYQNVEVTAPSNDKGVDVVADIELGITSVREVVQAKRQKSNVQRPVLDALRGSLHRCKAVRGTIVTTANFSKGAMEAAFETGASPITLINGDKLIDLLIEYGVGVRTRSVEVLELDADAFAMNDDELVEID